MGLNESVRAVDPFGTCCELPMSRLRAEAVFIACFPPTIDLFHDISW